MKSNVWIHDMGKKFEFFFQCVLAHREVSFFFYFLETTKRRAKKSSSRWLKWDLKNNALKYKKVKN